MDVALLTAMIGATAGIIGGGFSGQWQARLEREKWRRGISDAFTTELRASIKELTTKLASAAHSMCWLCWLAKFGAVQLTRERVAQYEEEMHVLLPQIASFHVVIASLDWDVYLKLEPLVKRLKKLDAQIGNANLNFDPKKPESAEELAQLYEQVQDLKSSLPEIVSEAVRFYSVDYRTIRNQELR